jgi:hypothetical protein
MGNCAFPWRDRPGVRYHFNDCGGVAVEQPHPADFHGGSVWLLRIEPLDFVLVPQAVVAHLPAPRRAEHHPALGEGPERLGVQLRPGRRGGGRGQDEVVQAQVGAGEEVESRQGGAPSGEAMKT